METKIPEGYWPDAKGCLIPESLIKPIDKERDALVREIAANAKVVNQALANFKGQAFGDIQAFIELSADQYDTKLGGKKGNITLHSFDGRFKLQRAIQESIAFDERLQAARALIDECLHEWTADAGPELRVIVDKAFTEDKEGNISTGRVLGLRRYDITDPRWLRAMTAISESVQVVCSTSYIRVYERIGDTDKYQPITLDVAGVP
ncbi:Protein of uncharacterised function (DUF3164) [Yersinia pseudotuberculosis]|uniref:DUF3164 family protein n=1 Tax=Yersinia pseudotuberculosis complex TaxID=1649845 RepID=UPI0005AD6456|nr:MULTISPECIES: DUF3164 family protein [Yersinia pseudotuberculosis complex]AJJ08223.1 hypothetical protein BZ20_3872 [Yersinia pseudotuberculosis]MBO1548735.1 DUF3164 family protein [Yersinia pseudotuberculosis]MBO1554589.1 DUF3164 family protein [Yersinia pseudotuberculosis]MBO1561847.1 DUF3164 family protein [Yersinia pseudotuberculosis]MBO1568986.1 DUF3164 family protein [Yersinia pseudotuberculosis]